MRSRRVRAPDPRRPAGALFLNLSQPLFGHPIVAEALNARLPAAYRDWSAGVLEPRPGDLAIPARANPGAVAEELAKWLSGPVTLPFKPRARAFAQRGETADSVSSHWNPGVFSGYVVDESDSTRKFVVEILIDGHPVKIMRADAHVHELAARPDRGWLFWVFFCVAGRRGSEGSLVEARAANLTEAIGSAIALDHRSPRRRNRRRRGRCVGSAVCGSRAGSPASGCLRAPISSLTAFSSPASGLRPGAMSARPKMAGAPPAAWTFTCPNDSPTARCTTCRRSISKTRARGSPLAFLAFAGGLNETLLACGASEINRTRAELFNQLAPMSLPMSDYQGWRKRLPVAPGPLASLRGAVIAVGPGAMDETLASLDAERPLSGSPRPCRRPPTQPDFATQTFRTSFAATAPSAISPCSC